MADSKPVQQHGAAVLVAEPLEEGEALLQHPLGDLNVPADKARASVRPQRMRTEVPVDRFRLGVSE